MLQSKAWLEQGILAGVAVKGLVRLEQPIYIRAG